MKNQDFEIKGFIIFAGSMKKFVLVFSIFFLTYILGFSQNINIPDEIFKNYLIELGIDENSDGEISYDEAESYEGKIIVDSLNINDLTGIEAFKYISKLSASFNNLTFLILGYHYYVDSIIVNNNNLDTLYTGHCQNLKFLKCADNNLTTVVVSFFCKLEEIYCAHNSFNTIEFPPVTDNYLKFLDCSYNNITFIDLDNWHNLIELNCSNNSIDSIHFVEDLNLEILSCQSNNLTQLSVPDSLNIESLNCSFNHIDTLTINSLLKHLSCESNEISIINLSESSQLKYLNCSNNNISTLSLANQTQLISLDCSHNEMTELSFNECQNIETILFANNHLADINLVYNFNLNLVDLSYNSDFKVLCVNQLPLLFQFLDEGIVDYKIEVCTQEFSQVFKAGQVLGTYNFHSDYIDVNGESSYDLSGDSINDIKFSYTIISYPNWGEIFYFINPINGSKIRLNSIDENDTIYPSSSPWSSDSLQVYYGIGDNGGYWTYWYLDGDYLCFKIINDSDTLYSYIQLDQTSSTWPDNVAIIKYACWTPCNELFTLGNDTLITLKDTLVLNAGNDFHSYYWNTEETSPSINIIGQNWGEGVYDIGVYVNKYNCYYTDTIRVQIIDDSGITEIENSKLNVYPNPTKDQLTIIYFGDSKGNIFLSLMGTKY